jgi:hypothetical protein
MRLFLLLHGRFGLMSCRILRGLIPIALLLLTTSVAISADTPAWTAQDAGTRGQAGDFSLGYRFTVANLIQLTQLGCVDYDGDGLAMPALARLYNWDSGAALAETIIPAGITGRELNGVLGVQYAALTNAITLLPGTNYLVAVEVTGGDFASDVVATMANQVQWIEGRSTPAGSPAMPATATSVSFPTANTINAKCFLGPSFKFLLPTITLSQPKTRQVTQRDGSNRANIRVQGNLSGTAARLEARAVVMPGATNNGLSTDWIVVVNAATNGAFSGTLPGVTAGGWYRVEVRAVDAEGNVLASVGIDRVGVGDVFVTAGQSNAACYGSPTQQPFDNRVSTHTLSSGNWRLATDPQPDNSGGMGGGGSPWPRLGSLLVRSNLVPIGFICVAYGGTAVSQWAPGTGLYSNLTNTLVRFGTNGVRAVLWHQGESDSLVPTSASVYAQALSNIVARSRIAAGWSVPWGIAEVSFHPSATRALEEPVAAGQRLMTYTTTNCFRGAHTDDFHLENKLSDTVHFNATGLNEHAQQWADALCGVQNLSIKNGNFESNAAVADGVNATAPRVVGWNRLNSAGTGIAAGGNGYFNPGTNTYPDAADSVNGGVLPNMNGRHVGTLAATATNNAFLQTLSAHLQPSTIYTFSVALGVRTNTAVFGDYRLDFLANGLPLGTGTTGDLTTLNTLAGGNATGAFTVVSCVYTSSVSVPTNQQLGIQITKLGGTSTYLDFDNVQVTSQLTPYGQWQMLHWTSVTDPASLPEADPDSDGLPNLIESQLAGMNPRVRDAMPLPVAIQLGGEDYIQMQLFKNQTTFGDVGLLMSHDLVHWFAPTNEPNGNVIIIDNTSEFTVQLRWNAIPVAFFRIWATP